MPRRRDAVMCACAVCGAGPRAVGMRVQSRINYGGEAVKCNKGAPSPFARPQHTATALYNPVAVVLVSANTPSSASVKFPPSEREGFGAAEQQQPTQFMCSVG